MRSFYTLLAVSLFSALSFGQSISGNVSTLDSRLDLGYANIDIYQGESLVASVIADADGNFYVSLDTGTYRCEIQFFGYEKISQEFVVTDDEKADFSLKEDKEVMKDVIRTEEIAHEKRSSVPARYMDAMSTTDMDAADESSGAPLSIKYLATPADDIPRQEGPGQMTAGELNDFSKWNLWTDLKEGEFKMYSNFWELTPLDRYMVEVTDRNGLPLVDVRAELKNASDQLLFSARTDNTGKAELWAGTRIEATALENLKIVVTKGDQIKTIRKAKRFGQGTNRKVFSSDCEQFNIVDIAFVVDATGSMADEINFLKAEINDVIFRSKSISDQLNLRFANLFYRDHGDSYLTRKQGFTRVLSEATNFIKGQHADGGGDTPEAVEVALDSAINGLEWSSEARARLLFLVLDAPPHNTPEIKNKMIDLSKLAAEKGIRIIPITASGIDKATEYLLRSVALLTNGTYTFITNHSGIGGHHIEPTTDQYEVEFLNQLLVRLIKSFTYMPSCSQEMPDLDIELPDSSVTIASDSMDQDSNSLEPLQWKYYPNPTRGKVNIVANRPIGELHITDLSGKILHRITDIKAEERVQADLYGHASGIYLIRYPLENNWISGKIVLLR